jgi:signal transduction histidine kinase
MENADHGAERRTALRHRPRWKTPITARNDARHCAIDHDGKRRSRRGTTHGIAPSTTMGNADHDPKQGNTMTPLYDIPLFEDTTDDELEWIRANSCEVAVAHGEYVIREGEPAHTFHVVLEGELQVTRTIDGQQQVLGTTPRGIIGNELPLLNGTPSPSTVRAITPSRLLVFDVPAFRAIFANCPTVGAKILRVATQRMQGFAGIMKQQEKMAALGKLSAGLAHELNNPAAAARRAARTLRDALPELEARTAHLCAAGLGEAQIATLAAFRRAAQGRAATAAPLSTIQQSDAEEELGAWLEDRDVSAPWEIAPTLAAARVTPAELEQQLAALPPAATAPAVAWLHQALLAAGLLDEVEQSARRISELVGAVKSYTYMDQAPVQEVDLHRGLEDTLAVLKHKLRAISVRREYDPELPHIQARGGELNQVWTNLLDNAIDALAGTGEIRVITRCENSFAMVEIADNGPGIPADVLPRIFEPFYTTKGVGAGTGLGLDISYRIIRQHGGTIEVQSHPGETRFIVRLPVGE